MSDKKYFNRSQVELLKKNIAYQGFYTVYAAEVTHPLFTGGSSAVVRREVMQNKNAVGVLLFDPQLDCVALVEQFRIGAFIEGEQNPWLFEIVAGLVEEDEQVQQVAIRESWEEAGRSVYELQHIADYYSSPGSTTQKFSLFCGLTDLAGAGGTYGLDEEDEDIRVHVLSTSALFDMVEQKKISNAHTLVAAQWLQLHHLRLMQHSA